jgi:BirA family transcriptional regulator, biotin operon repressor / biotin---[acetyl-CoA-carboxylase] ligase
MLARVRDRLSAEGDWLVADIQTAGRGRLGREWQSPPGNLYASTLVRLQTGAPDAATLALVAAVAVFEALACWCDAVALQIKWPNDILGRGAKLTGILLERASHAVVVGIGVNLVAHPEALDRPTTSLAALGGTPPAVMDFAETLAEVFARWLGIWRSAGLNPIRDAWLDRAHPVDTALTVNLPDGERIDGLFDGLTSDCALRLRLADGAVRVIHAGDVFLV